MNLFQNFEQQFVVTITGGTGAGVFVPEMKISGTENASFCCFYSLGTSTTATWPDVFSFTAGDPQGDDNLFYPPVIYCGGGGPPPFKNCDVPFTFGVPLLVDFKASMYSSIGLLPSLIGTQFDSVTYTVQGAVSFYGIQVESRSDGGNSRTAEVDVTLLPEPVSASLVGLGLLGLALCRQRLWY